MRVKLAGYAILALFLFALAEIASFAVLTLTPQLRPFLYTPPPLDRALFDQYMATRDPVTGWPGQRLKEEVQEADGARISPANAALTDAPVCVSLYGDSFTFSQDVGPEAAWGDVMARRLGCQVKNYGFGGFGTDQALLRFEQHLEEGRPQGVVILGIYPDNLNRNMNQWRALLGAHPLAFKPRFRLEGGEAAPVPLFSGDFAALERIARDPAAHLPHEGYAPNAPGFRRPTRVAFPYSLTLTRVAWGVAATFRGFEPWERPNLWNYPSYYDSAEGMSDEKRALALALLRRFAKRCEEAGLTCASLLIPGLEMASQAPPHDLAFLTEADPRLIALDASRLFPSADAYCASLVLADRCQGHFGPDGYASLAAFVIEELQSAGALPKTP